MNTLSAINIFRNSNEKNLHFNFFRPNGQILCQIYNLRDFIRWDLGVEFSAKTEEGYVIELRFSKSKTNNESNYERFRTSELYKNFQKNDKSGKAYYCYLPNDWNDQTFETFLKELLVLVYGQNLEFHFELNAY